MRFPARLAAVFVAAAFLAPAALAQETPDAGQPKGDHAGARPEEATDSEGAPTPDAGPGKGEIPAEFEVRRSGFDYDRREAAIPMRDGVKLHTVILVPRAAHHVGILLTRTPYNANDMTRLRHGTHLGTSLDGYDSAPDVVTGGGYIRVVQDVRGKYGSEGAFTMNGALAHTKYNPTDTDDATDAYDTIDWLVKHVPESNGRVVILGISYDGYTALMATINPHPALMAAVPMNPMVDGWMGDDWFRNGAFVQQNLPYIYEQEGARANEHKWWSGVHDDYTLYMRAGSAGELGREHGLEQTGFWRRILAHPAYDDFWSTQAVDKVLAARPVSTPMLLVHSLFDAEDIYAAPAVYRALKPKDPDGRIRLVLGPWNHGQEIEGASSLGDIEWGSDTGLWFRRHVLAPYLAHYLRDDPPPLDIAPVTAFETGTDEWRRLPRWPAAPDGAAPTPTALYLRPNGGLGFAPAGGHPQTEDYVSDPAKPVPFRSRPSQPVGYDNGLTWPRWLVDNQVEASGRTDVLSFTTAPLTAPLRITGAPAVHLTAATSGTDSDWVVKLIDVYPDETTGEARMGGYQMGVAMNIFRGRYREGFAAPKPLKADAALAYRFDLPAADHVFLPGHRIMVQVQSSWFPLYDRNPQTFTPSIMWAKPADYVKATQRITVAGPLESFVDLPVTQPPILPLDIPR